MQAVKLNYTKPHADQRERFGPPPLHRSRPRPGVDQGSCVEDHDVDVV